jgi:hypothetical protein
MVVELFIATCKTALGNEIYTSLTYELFFNSKKPFLKKNLE